MREFVENVDRVNGLADKIEGFVWRLKDESGHAMNMRVYDDPTILPNLTVWENVEALERFVWQTLHRRFFPARRMVRAGRDHAGLVADSAGHRPDMAEGVARLDHLIAHGPSDHAFGWQQLPGAKLWKRRIPRRRENTRHDQAHRRRQRDRRPAGVHAAAGLRGRGRGNSALLLPRAAVDRRQLPHVPGRGGRLAEAGGVLRLGVRDCRPDRRASRRRSSTPRRRW